MSVVYQFCLSFQIKAYLILDIKVISKSFFPVMIMSTNLYVSVKYNIKKAAICKLVFQMKN